MDSARDPIRTQFSNRLAIETPEHVVVELELAGLGSRLAAVTVDAFFLGLMIVVTTFVILKLATIASTGMAVWIVAVGIGLVFLGTWGYFVLFEAFSGGRTPGKQLLGLRTVLDTGHPLTFGPAAARNLLRVLDSMPFIGLPLVLLHPQNKRLGDLVAGTIVVRERPGEVAIPGAAVREAAAAPDAEGAPELSDREYALLSQLIERLADLDPGRRERLVSDVVGRLAPRYPNRSSDPETFLIELFAAEQARRRGRFATGSPAGPAARFVMLKRGAWEEFRARAAQVELRGLRALTPRAIPAFAALYREVAADLARARTYGVDPRVLEYLERVVTAGHNAIYGPLARRGRLSRILLRELPAAVVRERLAVLAAFALFAIPAIGGYFAIRERPATAYELLPESIIARAEAGVSEAATGTGYAETPDPFLPVVASGIIANNVQVAFGAFVFGITAGLGTFLILAFNGLFLGAVLGVFANYGIATWLLTFVAGHGVLELAAIFVAGGAGLVLARALIAPGELRRRDALIVQGRTAISMIGAATCLLILAGVIEGFLSASDAAPAVKFGVSAASVVLLGLYLANGYLTDANSAEGPVPSRGDPPRAR